MNALLRFRSAILVLSIPALWLGSFTFSIQLDHAKLSDEFTFIPVSIHASQSADYSADPSGDKFAPVDEDIFRDVLEDNEDNEETGQPAPPSKEERDDDGSSGDQEPARGHGRGNAWGHSKGKGPKK